MEYAVLVLVLTLTLVLTIYNRRQARALETMARLEEDRTAREIRDRREKKAQELRIDPPAWLEKQINALVDAPLVLKLTEGSTRVYADVQAYEMRAEDGRRLVVSTQPLAILRRYDRRSHKARGKGAAARLSEFADTHILGGKLRVWSASRTMADANAETFDIEAEALGKAVGIEWGAPTRLWFYVL
jgi:hypothetical protein